MFAQADPAGRSDRGGIQQHIETQILRRPNQAEIVPDT